MDQVPLPRDSQRAHRVGPRCGGGNLGKSPSKGDPGGARRRPLLRFLDTDLDRRPAYTPCRKRATSRSASREAEGTGPVKPRQPASAARCQTRPGASPGGCVERVRKETKCPRKAATVF